MNTVITICRKLNYRFNKYLKFLRNKMKKKLTLTLNSLVGLRYYFFFFFTTYIKLGNYVFL